MLEDLYPPLPTTVLDNVIAIYLYGSVARKQNDDNSDYDVLLCIEDCSDEKYFELKNIIEKAYKDTKYEFSLYQLSTIKLLYNKGSYFLWHLKMEAIPLFEKNSELSDLLKTLPKYSNTLEDFKEYYDILQDIKLSMSEGDYLEEYELSILATIARNTCIGLCYLLNNMDFGRITPVIKCKEIFGSKIPFSVEDYINLYNFRINYNRQKQVELVSANKSYIIQWIINLERLLSLASSIKEIK